MSWSAAAPRGEGVDLPSGMRGQKSMTQIAGLAIHASSSCRYDPSVDMDKLRCIRMVHYSGCFDTLSTKSSRIS